MPMFPVSFEESPKGPCTQIVYTLALMWSLCRYFRANVYITVDDMINPAMPQGAEILGPTVPNFDISWAHFCLGFRDIPIVSISLGLGFRDIPIVSISLGLGFRV